MGSCVSSAARASWNHSDQLEGSAGSVSWVMAVGRERQVVRGASRTVQPLFVRL
jgi:hypothetical protein